MKARDVAWLRGFLHLDARALADGIPPRDIERQEQTVLRALELFDERPGVVLADEVGMGKTFEAIGVAAAMRHMNGDSRIVVLTPGPDLNTKWEKEFQKFGEGRSPMYAFGDQIAAVRTLNDFVTTLRQKHVVIAPITIFNTGKGGKEQAYLLSLYCFWKKLHWNTTNAILRRYNGGKQPRVDVSKSHFLEFATLEEIEPHLDAAFGGRSEEEVIEGGPLVALDTLHQAEGDEVFGRHELVRRALNLARFRLVRALMPDVDLLILDEAHKLKNAHTVRSAAVTATFRKKYRKALFLTATPFQLDITELRQVLALFSMAIGAPADLLFGADAFFEDIRAYQHAYNAFEAFWRALDPGLVAEFGELFERDPTLTSEVDEPSLRAVAGAARELLRLKREKIEPGFRTWMIRSIQDDKRRYRSHRRAPCLPEGESVLPFLIYERFIAELFRQKARTHKAAVQINMVSSYGAAREGELLADSVRKDLPPSAEDYRKLLRSVLDKLGARPSDHPKLNFVMTDALEAAERGDKTLVFCTRVETLSDLASELKEAWMERLLERWRVAYPGATRDDIFDTTTRDKDTRGRHARIRTRFHDPQDALYLALRERYLQSLLTMGPWAEDHLDEIIELANERRSQLRTTKTRASRLDYGHLKRCVEQAAATLWRTHCPTEGADYEHQLDVLTSPDFLTLGLDLELDDLENDERGRECPTWEIGHDAARLVVQHRPHLWGYLSSALYGLNRKIRVGVVERLARLLTHREVPFLADLLGAARASGLEVENLKSRELLDFVDAFWRTPAGKPWVQRLRDFLHYFQSRNESQQRDILEGPIATGALVRHTRDGESRERLREAFNTPLYPMILVANEVMQEGLDLHRHCRRIVHHDLAWNPAQLEQRVGRVDRIGSLTTKLLARDPSTKLDILYPLVHRTIDERLFRTVKSREKWLEFLLGARPDFSEYTLGDEEPSPLPERLASELRIDLKPRAETPS
ncbi:SNF2-related protein [Chondromyces crocatus]|nr:SNF2-related protein [Chondromyces crocatus]AKT41239.1 uncharacterized protein CMC5_054000 [Chondromyces crocatus]